MSGRRAAAAALLGLVLAVTGCSSTGEDAAPPALRAAPSPHCASDAGVYDGLRAYLAEHASQEPWIDRVSVCAGGLLEVDQHGMSREAARTEALAVCEAAAGYLITDPPPPERAEAPNPKEIGVIVADAEGAPVVLGAEDEVGVAGEPEAAREREAEREREAAREGEDGDEGAEGEGTAREPEPFRCFAPFA